MNKRVKKLVLSSLVALSMIGFVGCGSNTPTDVANSFEDALKKGDLLKVNTLLSEPAELNDDDKKEYKDQAELYAEVFRELDIKVDEEVIDGDTATISCNVTGPNLIKGLPSIMGDLFKEALAQGITGEEASEEEMTDLLFEKLASLPVDERGAAFYFVNVDGEWKFDSEYSDILMANILGGSLPSFE